MNHVSNLTNNPLSVEQIRTLDALVWQLACCTVQEQRQALGAEKCKVWAEHLGLSDEDILPQTSSQNQLQKATEQAKAELADGFCHLLHVPRKLVDMRNSDLEIIGIKGSRVIEVNSIDVVTVILMNMQFQAPKGIPDGATTFFQEVDFRGLPSAVLLTDCWKSKGTKDYTFTPKILIASNDGLTKICHYINMALAIGDVDYVEQLLRELRSVRPSAGKKYFFRHGRL